jgi:hypothetical protein
VNDPRGSGSSDFIDVKFEALGPIHLGRKPARDQPPYDNFPFHKLPEAQADARARLAAKKAKAQATANANPRARRPDER